MKRATPYKPKPLPQSRNRVIFFINELLRPLESSRFAVFGLVVMVTIIFIPEGLLGNIDFFRRIKQKTLFMRIK